MFALITQDQLFKEEIIIKDSFWQRGVFYQSSEEITYKNILGTYEPYRSDGEEGMVLPAGTSSSDARMLYSSEQLLGYEDSGDVSLADKVFLSNPEAGKTKPQRYVVMQRELWPQNSGFSLISQDDSNAYLLIKEEKAIANGVS